MKFIDLNGPAYRGAKFPKFNPKKINEERFEDGLRAKEYRAELNAAGTEGEFELLTQESDHWSQKLNDEVVRAFKANGAKSCAKIHVKFGCRAGGYQQFFTINLQNYEPQSVSKFDYI